MQIEADAVIPHARELVFRTYRDELPRLADAMSHVRSIEVEKRTELGHMTEIVNRWTVAGPIPQVAEKVLPQVLVFRDYARWDSSTFSNEWMIESEVFRESVRCSGQNTFVDLGGRTRFEMQGEIRLDLSRMRLVPELVVDGLASVVEKFLVRQITTSLVSVADGLTQYLSETRTQPNV